MTVIRSERDGMRDVSIQAAGAGGRLAVVTGAVVGGSAAGGVVSQTRGWQVVGKQATALTFTTNEGVGSSPVERGAQR